MAGTKRELDVCAFWGPPGSLSAKIFRQVSTSCNSHQDDGYNHLAWGKKVHGASTNPQKTQELMEKTHLRAKPLETHVHVHLR